MIKFIKKIASKLGIDRAISFVLIGRVFSFLSQPITLYLIAKFFSPSEQGYYYTFGSILSASIFLELGLGIVLTQFASHEYAFLIWKSDGSLTGDENSLSRLLTILRKSLKWYGILSIIFFTVLIPVGIIFFGSNRAAEDVHYILPWVFLVLSSAFSLFIYPILTVIEGCGKVAEIQKLKFYQLAFGAVSVWIIIYLQGTLFAASILAVTNFFVAAFWIMKNFSGLIKQLKLRDNKFNYNNISWRSEILPMQWRIALSWISGYLIYQLFNPLLFKYQSASVAGQMGMSITVANVVQGTAIAWISTKLPLYGSLIKQKQYRELDNLAWKSTIQALFFSISFSFAAIIFIYFIKNQFPNYGQRILSVSAITALLYSNIINIIITSLAGYLRAHKEEPFLINSLVGAFLTAFIAWISAKYFNANILCYSIAALNTFIGLPLAYFIFKKKRLDWGIEKIKLGQLES